MRYVLIVSSKANPKSLSQLKSALEYVQKNNSELYSKLEIRYTEYAGHASDLAVELSKQFGDTITIVACGGDGTIHEVANSLAFSKTPMVCMPFGTGNDYVKTVIPDSKKWDILHYLCNLDKVTVKAIDLIKIDSYDASGEHIKEWSSYMNNVASIGLDTEVQAMAKVIVAKKDTPFNRNTAYIQAALKALFGKRGHDFKFELELEDGSKYVSDKSRFTLLSICNAGYYGGGFCPAPQADITDGVADICAIDDVSLLRAIRLIVLYRLGKHPGNNGVSMLRAKSGVITATASSGQLMGNYDGEDFFGQKVRFEVQHEALNLGFFPDGGWKSL